MDLDIKREPGRFFVTMDGHESRLLYTIISGVMDIRDVFVHENHRGHGMASELCKAAFNFAKEKGYKVAPTCPYTKEKFVPEHPELKEMIFQGELFYRAKKSG